MFRVVRRTTETSAAVVRYKMCKTGPAIFTTLFHLPIYYSPRRDVNPPQDAPTLPLVSGPGAFDNVIIAVCRQFSPSGQLPESQTEGEVCL